MQGLRYVLAVFIHKRVHFLNGCRSENLKMLLTNGGLFSTVELYIYWAEILCFFIFTNSFERNCNGIFFLITRTCSNLCWHVFFYLWNMPTPWGLTSDWFHCTRPLLKNQALFKYVFKTTWCSNFIASTANTTHRPSLNLSLTLPQILTIDHIYSMFTKTRFSFSPPNHADL